MTEKPTAIIETAVEVYGRTSPELRDLDSGYETAGGTMSPVPNPERMDTDVLVAAGGAALANMYSTECSKGDPIDRGEFIERVVTDFERRYDASDGGTLNE